jgi:hypothetical protein
MADKPLADPWKYVDENGRVHDRRVEVRRYEGGRGDERGDWFPDDADANRDGRRMQDDGRMHRDLGRSEAGRMRGDEYPFGPDPWVGRDPTHELARDARPADAPNDDHGRFSSTLRDRLTGGREGVRTGQNEGGDED